MTISAPGFTPVAKPLRIIDNDKATLTITQLSDTVMEGNVVSFRINTNLPPFFGPLQVFLSSVNPSRLPLPSSVTIPAASNSVDVSVILAQDLVPENNLAVTMTAAAVDHFAVSASVFVKDDDVPGLLLDLQTIQLI